MKTSLQTKLGQQLTLTPQLRQAIRLLQLSSVELDLEINAAIEANPLLERQDEAAADGDAGTDGSEGTDAPADGVDAAPQADSPPDGRDGDDEFESAPDFDWDDGTGRGRQAHDGEDGEHQVAAPMDLHEHLMWQLRLSHLGPRDMLIGEALVEAIGADGYLELPLEDIAACLKPAVTAGLDEIEAVLHLVQHFDPLGVGARNLAECLGIQLGLLDPATPELELAKLIAAQHLDTLAKLGAARLAAQIKRPPGAVDAAVALLKSLDPNPGAQVSPGDTEFIVPDAIAYRQGGVWKVATAGPQPMLAINRHYERLIGKASREDDSYLRTQLQEARWLIKSLETRADTLLRVARSIVRQQSGFLEHGTQAMRPLTLREVAEELGLHESTISRATTRKYLRTPRGTFEFKYFFSSGIATDTGGEASSTAIQAMMKKLIEAENPRSPLSDARLAEMLKSDGIPVARRTVAKYREAMNIRSSTERQRL
jgi:RNA polymerase sigma-54 factor